MTFPGKLTRIFLSELKDFVLLGSIINHSCNVFEGM